jgi:hypothetical protein
VAEVAGEDQRQNEQGDDEVAEGLLAEGSHADILAKDN